LELGKAEGFTAKQMGDMIKEEMLKAGISLRTVQNYLPAEAKGKPRGITALPNRSKDSEEVEEEEVADNDEEAISANSAQNQNESIPSQPQTESEQELSSVKQIIEKKLMGEEPQESLTDNQKLDLKYGGRVEPQSQQQQEQEQEQLQPQMVTSQAETMLAEEYMVKYPMITVADDVLKTVIIKRESQGSGIIRTTMWLPLIIKVKPSQRDVTAEVDMEAYNAGYSNYNVATTTKPTTTDRPSLEAAQQIVQSQGIKSRDQWRNYCKAHPELHLPQKAAEGYGVSWPEFLGKASRLAPTLYG
jgi:hypothetical protein